jgi:hypothetical protein
MDVGLIAFSVLQGIYGVPAVISRRGDNCPATIVPGFTDAKAVNTREIVYSANAQDFLIAVSDYAPTGTPTEPEDNDVIVYDIAGETITTELLPISDAPCFNRWRGRSVYRVHTKVQQRQEIE